MTSQNLIELIRETTYARAVRLCTVYLSRKNLYEFVYDYHCTHTTLISNLNLIDSSTNTVGYMATEFTLSLWSPEQKAKLIAVERMTDDEIIIFTNIEYKVINLNKLKREILIEKII